MAASWRSLGAHPHPKNSLDAGSSCTGKMMRIQDVKQLHSPHVEGRERATAWPLNADWSTAKSRACCAISQDSGRGEAAGDGGSRREGRRGSGVSRTPTLADGGGGQESSADCGTTVSRRSSSSRRPATSRGHQRSMGRGRDDSSDEAGPSGRPAPSSAPRVKQFRYKRFSQVIAEARRCGVE